jgi:GNAT superfamily N-acetyltransferase
MEVGMTVASIDEEVRELNRLAIRDLALGFRRAPGFSALVQPGAAFIRSGETVADLNMLLIGDTPAPRAFFTEAARSAQGRDLPFIAFLSPGAAVILADAPSELGLDPAGSAPLMVFRADGPIAPGGEIGIRLAEGGELATAAGDLVSAAFGLERRATARAFETAIHPTSNYAVYVASADGTPVASVAITPVGDTAGVWCMATSPEHQGKGHGRALLSRVMEQHRQEGVRRFYLFATPAGRPLYESLGYETLADFPLWAWTPPA